MKKILLLGGSTQQIPALVTARELGYQTVLCDYLPDNPGQRYADKFYLISTTDQAAILEVAQREKVSGVLAYASDPAALTAAYVAEQLGLPGNPYHSVEILTNKDKYREFQSQNGFWAPKAKGYDTIDQACEEIDNYKLPVIVKPVDSSGSKGISTLSRVGALSAQAQNALGFSRNQRFIIEEIVEQDGYQVAGDGFVVNGKLVFRCFGNDHFDLRNPNPFVPVAASFPYIGTQQLQDNIHQEIQRLLSLLEIRVGAFNFDIRVDRDQRIYLMEIGPRNGGNYIPQVIDYATGVNMVKYSVKAVMGADCSTIRMTPPRGFWSYYALHSARAGILKGINIDSQVSKENVAETHLNYQIGDYVPAFAGSNQTIGILIMKFSSQREMLEMMDNGEQLMDIVVE